MSVLRYLKVLWFLYQNIDIDKKIDEKIVQRIIIICIFWDNLKTLSKNEYKDDCCFLWFVSRYVSLYTVKNKQNNCLEVNTHQIKMST